MWERCTIRMYFINSVLLTSPTKLLTTSSYYTFRSFIMFVVRPKSQILLHLIKPLKAHPLDGKEEKGEKRNMDLWLKKETLV